MDLVALDVLLLLADEGPSLIEFKPLGAHADHQAVVQFNAAKANAQGQVTDGVPRLTPVRRAAVRMPTPSSERPTDCDDSQISAWMNLSPKSSGFRIQISAARQFRRASGSPAQPRWHPRGCYTGIGSLIAGPTARSLNEMKEAAK